MFESNVSKHKNKRGINNKIDAPQKTPSTLKKIIGYCALSILVFGINTPMAFSADGITEKVTDEEVTIDPAYKFAGDDDELIVTRSIFEIADDMYEIDFKGGNDEMTVNWGVVNNDVNFGAEDDTLTLKNWARIDGELRFGDGNDKLIMDVGISDFSPSVITGKITGIETITKEGLGDVRFEGGQVVFKGGAAKSRLNLKEGGLIIDGTVNLDGGQVLPRFRVRNFKTYFPIIFRRCEAEVVRRTGIWQFSNGDEPDYCFWGAVSGAAAASGGGQTESARQRPFSG